jgi:hypothetical protein
MSDESTNMRPNNNSARPCSGLSGPCHSLFSTSAGEVERRFRAVSRRQVERRFSAALRAQDDWGLQPLRYSCTQQRAPHVVGQTSTPSTPSPTPQPAGRRRLVIEHLKHLESIVNGLKRVPWGSRRAESAEGVMRRLLLLKFESKPFAQKLPQSDHLNLYC